MTGSPTETALLHLALLAAADIPEIYRKRRLESVRHRGKHRRRMITVHREVDGSACISVKGNPMEVAGMCRWLLKDGAAAPLTAARLLHVYNCRRRGRRPGTNPYLTLATAAAFGLQLAPFFVPGLRRVLKIAPLTPVDLAIAGVNAGLALIVNKRLRRGKALKRNEVVTS